MKVQLCQITLREKGQTKQHPGPPGWGLSAGLITLPCKTYLLLLAIGESTIQLQEIQDVQHTCSVSMRLDSVVAGFLCMAGFQ